MSLSNHTNRVIFLRVVFPVLAVIGLLIVIGWPIVTEMKEKARTSALSISAEEVSLAAPATGTATPQLQVTKPEFSGVTAQGQPYVITAERVLQGLKTDTPMMLEAPRAKMSLDADKSAALEAQSGVYNPKEETLELQNSVVLTHSDGYKLDMQGLSVDLKSGSAHTDNPVFGNGPGASLSGEKLELRDKGGHIILYGKSKLVLTPQKKT